MNSVVIHLIAKNLTSLDYYVPTYLLSTAISERY